MADNFRLKVKNVVQQTADTVSIEFDQPENFEYKAGQFLTFLLEVDGKKVRRSYSLSSCPSIGESPSVAVKRVEGGLVSNHINDNIKVGDELEVMEPMGNFYVETDKDKQRHIILIGGGSGITPLLGILKTILHGEPQSIISLIYANKTADDIIYKKELDELQHAFSDRFRLVHHLNNENVEKYTKEKKSFFGLKKKDVQVETSGQLDEKVIADYITNNLNVDLSLDPVEFYLCGPQGLMKLVEKTLKENDVPQERIAKESFVKETFDKEAKGGDSKARVVQVVLDDETHEFEVSDKSILLTALDKGIEMPYSCQSGICTACMGKLISGEIEMEHTDGLSPEQIEEGYRLTCIGHPKTDDVKIEIVG